jgi:multicomponent Na+:H+ antiporter subunit C
VILTAIVISLSIQALLLVVLTRLSRFDPLLETASFESLMATPLSRP